MSWKEKLKFFIDTVRKVFLELCQVRLSSQRSRLDLPNEGGSFAIYFLPADPFHRSFEQKLGDTKERQIDGEWVGFKPLNAVPCTGLHGLVRSRETKHLSGFRFPPEPIDTIACHHNLRFVCRVVQP
jgi:hypothetical protein